MGGADDDVGNGGCDADLDAGVALLSELALEELVQLGVEDTVCVLLATHSRIDRVSSMRRRPRPMRLSMRLSAAIARSHRSRISTIASSVAGSVQGGCSVPATNFLLLEMADWVVAIFGCRTVG